MSVEEVREAMAREVAAKEEVEILFAKTYDEGNHTVPQLCRELGIKGMNRWYDVVRTRGMRAVGTRTHTTLHDKLVWKSLEGGAVEIGAYGYELAPGRVIYKVGVFDPTEELPNPLLEELWNEIELKGIPETGRSEDH